MEIKDQFLQLRKKMKLNQNEFADLLGVSFSTINRIENGKTKPNNSTLASFNKLCNNNQFIAKEDKWCSILSSERIQGVARQKKGLMINKIPTLINQLLNDSNNKNIIYKEIPSDSDVTRPGYDITLETQSINRFIPNGKSIWEIGVKEDLKSKIEEDFIKRSENLSIEEKKSTTYVAVTPLFVNNKNILKQKLLNIDSNWKDVRIYDSTILEDWLSYCPLATKWFCKEFTNIDIEYSSIEDEYKSYLGSTNPNLVPELFLESRDDIKDNLINRVLSNKGMITICGHSFKDSYGFILSSLFTSEDIDNGDIIVAYNKNSLKQLQNFVSGRIIVLKQLLADDISLDDNNTYIVIANKNYDSNGINDVELEIRPKSILSRVLSSKMGLSTEKIEDLFRYSDYSVDLIIRRLSNNEKCIPEWEKRKDIGDLIPIFIVGKINIENDADKTIIEKFLGKESINDYYSNVLSNWKDIDDSPLYFYNNKIVKVNCKNELWYALQNKITDNHINDIVKILTDAFDEKSSIRINNYQINNLFDVLNLDSNKNSIFIDCCINSILNSIKTQKQIVKLSEYFDNISECSPRAFVDFSKEIIVNKKELIDMLFDSMHSWAFASSNYQFLLFALEKCTCFEDTKIDALDCILELTKKEIDYKNNYTPFESLLKKLNPLNTNSALTIEDKKQYITRIISKKETDIDRFLVAYYDMTSFFERIGIFKFKTPVFTENINYHQLFDINRTVLKLCLEHSNNIEESITKLLDKDLHKLNYSDLEIIYEFIKDNIKNESIHIYNSLINLRYIRKLSSDSKELEKINKIIAIVEPKDFLQKEMIYFTSDFYNCPLLECKDLKYEDKEEAVKDILLDKFRKLKSIYSIGTIIEEILIINKRSDIHWLFDLCDYNESELELVSEKLLDLKKYDYLATLLNANNQFGNRFIKNLKGKDLEELIYVLGRGFYMNRLNLEDELKNDELCELYYKERRIFNDTDDFELQNIKKYNTKAYLEYVAFNNTTKDFNVNELLDTILEYEFDRTDHHIKYSLTKILDDLDKTVYNYKLAEVQLKYIDLYYDKFPICLSRYLIENPLKFLDIEKTNIYNSNWFILHDKLFIPISYIKESVIINFINVLLNYGNNSKDDNCYYKHLLGSILARSSDINTNFCPGDSISNFIEYCNDDEVNIGFAIGYYNSLGVRNVTNGDDLKIKADSFKDKANEIAFKYPNTSRALKYISQRLISDSARERIDYLEFNDIL